MNFVRALLQSKRLPNFRTGYLSTEDEEGSGRIEETVTDHHK